MVQSMIKLLPAIIIGTIGLFVLCGCNNGKLHGKVHGKVYQWVEVGTFEGTKRIVPVPLKQDLVDASWNITTTNSEVTLRFAVKGEQ